MLCAVVAVNVAGKNFLRNAHQAFFKLGVGAPQNKLLAARIAQCVEQCVCAARQTREGSVTAG